MPDKGGGERKDQRPVKTGWEVEPNFTFDPALFGFPARGHNLQFSGCPNNRRGDYLKAKASWQAFSKMLWRAAGMKESPTLFPGRDDTVAVGSDRDVCLYFRRFCARLVCETCGDVM